MRITKNFTLDELCKSELAIRKGIDNTPTDEVTLNLITLTKKVLQPIRDKLGVVVITSGYRSPALNKAVGGSAKSDHCQGFAADFEVVGMDNKEVAKWIIDNLVFKQLILEFYTEGIPDSGWVHCSFEEGANNNEVLQAKSVNKKVVYTQGIP